ncbi:MAG TPA: GtrA family protein [Mucilaginibacter sp.]|nr:GtrA family protein [Mucilaginibacter sp.]
MGEINIGNKLLDNHIIRFIFSAGIGFLVDISAFYLFYHNILVQKSYQLLSFTVRNSTLSLTISFFMGVVVNFLITKYFVFAKSTSSSGKQFVRFVIVAIVGFFANLALLKFFTEYLNIYPPVARPLAALSLFFASYFIHRVFSFSLSLRQEK